jgi:hypothetical protein
MGWCLFIERCSILSENAEWHIAVSVLKIGLQDTCVYNENDMVLFYAKEP